MNEALKLKNDNLFPDDNVSEVINIDELKSMNDRIIKEANRLTKNAEKLGNRSSKGEKISKEEIQIQSDGWKQLRELEKCYSFLMKKAKQKGIKQKDVDNHAEAAPDIDEIKKSKGTIGAIIRKI